MLCVGLTGLMGTGKSTVGQVLVGLGLPLYNCDDRAKELMQTQLRDQIIEMFGEHSFQSDGRLDRLYLATKVFADQSQLKRLEHIVHPAVDADIRHWVDLKSTAVPYVVIESAILIGNQIERLIDHMVVVTADTEVIIDRVMRRDGATRQQVEQRLAAQMDAEQIIGRADSVLLTSQEELLIPKVVALHEKLLTLSKLSEK